MKCCNHPDGDGKWQCVACRRVFCENCVKTFGGRAEHVEICPICGEKCEDLSKSEEAVIASETSFWARLPGIVTYPFQRDGPFILLAGAVVFPIAYFFVGFIAAFVAGLIGMANPILSFAIGIFILSPLVGYLCRYFLAVVSDSAMGKPSPPTWPEFDVGSLISEGLGAMLKFIGPAALSFAPAALYYLFGPRTLDDLFVLLMVLGCLYYPMGLTAVAVFDDLGALLPGPILRSMSRVPLSYLGTSILFMGLLFLNYLGQKYLVIRVFIIGSVIRWFVLLYLWTATMHLLGMFYYSNRQKLQWA
jgi:hypothetical protein